jgi:hypothetical protein
LGLSRLELAGEEGLVLDGEGVRLGRRYDVEEVVAGAMRGVEEGVAEALDVAAADVMAEPANALDAGLGQAPAGDETVDLVHGDHLADEAPVDGQPVAVDDVSEGVAAEGPVAEEAGHEEERGGRQVGPQQRHRYGLGQSPAEEEGHENEGPERHRSADDGAQLPGRTVVHSTPSLA